MARDIALITGASSGIGEALAEQFAGGGFDLVLVARSEDKLRELARTLKAAHGIKAWVEPADLTKRSAARQLAADVAERGLDISVLVNNAGVLEQGRFVDIAPATHQRLIDLNISGITSMLSQFLPGMVDRGAGRVLNVASVAAFQPVPSLATYAATKAYVLSLTESLSEELKGTGVTATALCPGVTDTNMVSDLQDKSEGLYIPEFAISDVEDVAKRGYRACMKGEVICIPGVVNQVTTLSGRATPKWLLRRVSGFIARYATKSD
jgi:short-subunit dehydrogenase